MVVEVGGGWGGVCGWPEDAGHVPLYFPAARRHSLEAHCPIRLPFPTAPHCAHTHAARRSAPPLCASYARRRGSTSRRCCGCGCGCGVVWAGRAGLCAALPSSSPRLSRAPPPPLNSTPIAQHRTATTALHTTTTACHHCRSCTTCPTPWAARLSACAPTWRSCSAPSTRGSRWSKSAGVGPWGRQPWEEGGRAMECEWAVGGCQEPDVEYLGGRLENLSWMLPRCFFCC